MHPIYKAKHVNIDARRTPPVDLWGDYVNFKDPMQTYSNQLLRLTEWTEHKAVVIAGGPPLLFIDGQFITPGDWLCKDLATLEFFICSNDDFKILYEQKEKS